MTFSTWLRDTVERVVVTFVLAVLALLSADGLTDFNTEFAAKLATAGLVAAAVAIKNTALPDSGLGLSAIYDVLSRVGWSFAQGVAGVIAADAGFQWYSATAWHAALAGGALAAFSVVKGVLALRMSEPTVTPASLAPAA